MAASGWLSVRLSVRLRSWLVAGLASAVVPPLVMASPGWAQEVEPPDAELPGVECPEFEGEPAAEDELTAYQYAVACGVEVEVTGLRDVDREVFARPDGLLDARVAVEPYQVRDGSGAWVPIDPTLVTAADGSAASAATVIDVVVGAGGGNPFVTATDPDGGVLSLSWPGGGLPAPVVAGAVATYPEVLPGVDLAVQAEAVGFSWVLVVKTPQAAANPDLSQISVDVDTVGLDVVDTDGGVEVVDDAGEVVFEAGQAIMWDSSQAGGADQPAGFGAQSEPAPESDPDSTDPGRIGEVEVEVTGSGIDLVPDAEMLADESVTYPVFIDPPFTSSRKAWANVFAGAKSRGWTGDSSWPRSGGMRVGYNTWPTCGDGCGLWRSVIRLNIGTLNGKYIHSATVKALQTHTGGCGSYGLQLWRTKAISNSVSWNDVSWLYGRQLDTQSPPSSNQTGCGSGHSNEWVRFDSNVKKRVQSAADARYDSISFGFQSSSEGNRDAWRRIRTSSVRLEVVYYLYPPKPDRLALNGQSCRTSASDAAWVTSRHPTMSARARSQESESVYVRFRVRERGSSGNFYYYRTPDPVGAYSTVNRRIGTSLPDGEYTWQARTDSRHTSAVNSGYTSLCYFNVDATKPSTPSVTAPDGPFTEGDDLSIGLSSSDPVVNGTHSGLNRYEYSWNTPAYDQTKAPTGSTTVTRDDVAAGRHVLYVRSVDNAGNASDERTYTFFVGRDIPATPMAAWRLGGDLADDSGNRKDSGEPNDLVPAAGGTPAFVNASGDRALRLDGRTCLTADAPVRTDAALTVALRLRMDAKPASYAKVLTQGGPEHSVYQIQYSTSTNMWSFSMLSEDYAWHSVRATNPAGLGQWLHITGTYDPDAGVSRIYFDGELAGERPVDFAPWNGQDTFGLGCLRGASGSTGHFFTGAVDNVGVWAGLLSPREISRGADLPAGEIGRWRLNGGGTDDTRFGRDLTVPESAQAAFDPFGRPDGALVLDGQSCASTQQAVIPSDERFGIAAWVRPQVLEGGYQVLMAHADSGGDGFILAMNADGDWEFGSAAQLAAATATGTAMVPAGLDAPARAGGGFGTMASGSYLPPTGQWQHVALQHQGSSWSLTINSSFYDEGNHSGGQLPGAAGISSGPLTVGCADVGQGFQNFFTGMVHDVRVWRGFKTSSDIYRLYTNPPAELQGRWRLEMDKGEARDTSGNGHHLTFEGETQIWDGYSCDPDSALSLAGAGSAATGGPVVATDESFTVSAWVRMDRLDTAMTFVSAAGENQTGFRLTYSATRQRFEFVMTSGDVSSATDGFRWHIADGGPAPEVDMWYHLVGVYDLRAGEIHLSVNGARVATAAGPTRPWAAGGPVVLGAAARVAHDGYRWNLVQGAIDDVVMWQGVVPDHVIDQMSPGQPIEMC